MDHLDYRAESVKERARVNSRDAITRSGRLKAKKKPEPGFNVLFVGLMLCYVMWQLVIWMFRHLAAN